MCVSEKEGGYKKSYCPHIDECLWYGDMSQLCILSGETCDKPWLDPDFLKKTNSEQ